MGKYSKEKESSVKSRIAAAVTVAAASGVGSIAFAPGAQAATSLTPAQVASYAKQGCPSLTPSQINTAVKIAGAESDRNPGVRNTNGEDSRGLWQINTRAHGSPWGNLFDPLTNARAMCDVSSKGANWRPWTTYVNGDYLNELGYLGSVGTPAPVKPKPSTPPTDKRQRPESVYKHDHYKVVKGDTLWDIAKGKDIKGGWKELYRWNTRIVKNPDLIFPGQELNLPSVTGNTSRPTVPAPGAKPKPGAAYVKPVNASVSKGFGIPEAGYTLGYHTGTDFRSNPPRDGAPVVATSAGTVVASDTSGPYGINVQIKHDDGKYTLSAHLSSKSVSVGQRVKPGQLIGRVGHTPPGRFTYPHLHFEVRKAPYFAAGNFLNPVSYLRSHGVAI